MKRKSRNTINKLRETDLLSIPIMDLGSDNDPCFAKLYNPQCSECSRCGDSEFCAIAMGQNNHKVRDKIEKEQSFLDKEENGIPKESPEEIKKQIIKKIISTIRVHKNGITHEELKTIVHKQFLIQSAKPESIDRLIKIVVANPKRKIITKKGKYYGRKEISVAS